MSGVTDSANYTAFAVAPVFEDISGTGTVITGLTNVDDASVSIPIGFTFPLHGVANTTVFVSSNGLLTFGTGNTAFTNADLTTTPAQASIAPRSGTTCTRAADSRARTCSSRFQAQPDQRLDHPVEPDQVLHRRRGG